MTEKKTVKEERERTRAYNAIVKEETFCSEIISKVVTILTHESRFLCQ
jgi:hypothetical protein